MRARTQCEVVQIVYDQLRNLTQDLPEVLFAVLGQLAIRLRDTRRKVGDLAFVDVAGPVLKTLEEQHLISVVGKAIVVFVIR